MPHKKYLQQGVDQARQVDIDLVEGTGQVDIDLVEGTGQVDIEQVGIE